MGCAGRRYEMRGDTGRPITAKKRMISVCTRYPSVRQSNRTIDWAVRRGLRQATAIIRGLEGGDGLISRLKNSVSESYSSLFASIASSATESPSCSCSCSVARVVCGVTYAIPHGALPIGEDLLVDKV